MKYLSVLLVLALAGCASVPAPDKLDVMSDIERMEKMEITVEDIPASPEMKRIEQDGQVYGGFDLEGLDDLLFMRRVARQNTEMLRHMIAANDALVEERNHILDMAIELERVANSLIDELYKNEKWVYRSEAIKRLERLSYQLGIIAAGSR